MPKWMRRSPAGFNLTNIKKCTQQLKKATDQKFERAGMGWVRERKEKGEI